MLIFAGSRYTEGGDAPTADGAVYSPTSNKWSTMKPPQPPQPPAMNYSGTAVWTGAEMLLWGAVYDCSGDCTQTVTGFR